MKRWILTVLALLLAALTTFGALGEGIAFTDTTGAQVALPGTPTRVVALLGSYGDMWLQAGGALAGVTDDAVSEAGLELPGDIARIGSNKQPNLELILALQPDFVILSDNTSGHLQARPTLEAAGIPCAALSVMNWREYMDGMRLFTHITGRDDLYEAQRQAVEAPIEALIAEAEAQPDFGAHTALLLRAFTGQVKAKDSQSTVAGQILRDMGLVNVADSDAGLMENLSMEAIIALDPDYIFVVHMGADGAAAERAIDETLRANPAFDTLTAVREGRFITLDRQLFHYRPNARWAEAYRQIWEIVYGAQ